MSNLDKTNHRRKRPREGMGNKISFVCTLKNPMETLNGKPSYICKEPGAAPLQTLCMVVQSLNL